MKAISMILPVAAIAALGGCTVMTNGKTETRQHALSGFDSVTASSGIDVVLTEGPFGVKSEAPEGKLDRITIEQSGRELKIDMKHEITIGWSGRYQVNVSAPAYTAISASGGADVEATSLQAERLVLSVAGGADIDIAGARIGVLEASVSGGGDIDVGARTVANGVADSGGDVRFLGSPTTFTADKSSGGDVNIDAR
jgi:hypothetical protein